MSESHFSPPPPHHIWSDFRLPPPSPLEQTSFVHAPLVQVFSEITREQSWKTQSLKKRPHSRINLSRLWKVVSVPDRGLKEWGRWVSTFLGTCLGKICVGRGYTKADMVKELVFIQTCSHRPDYCGVPQSTGLELECFSQKRALSWNWWNLWLVLIRQRHPTECAKGGGRDHQCYHYFVGGDSWESVKVVKGGVTFWRGGNGAWP